MILLDEGRSFPLQRGDDATTTDGACAGSLGQAWVYRAVARIRQCHKGHNMKFKHILALGVVVLVAHCMLSSDDSADPPQAAAAASGANRADARSPARPERKTDCKEQDQMAPIQADKYVRPFLKAPSTAKFGPAYLATIVDLEHCKYRVTNYVDSQNGFGAMIRTHYTVDVRHHDGRRTWSGSNLVIH